MTVREVKCVVVGDSAVGKIDVSRPPHLYVPIAADDLPVTVMIGDESYTLRLFDVVDQEKYDTLRPLTYPETDIFLLCFNVTSPTSFEKVKKKWFPEVERYCPGVPFIIMGTQVDLREREQHAFSREAGERLAKELGAVKYVECSAQTVAGLKEVFQEAIVAALERPNSKKKRTECVIL